MEFELSTHNYTHEEKKIAAQYEKSWEYRNEQANRL